MWTQRQPDKTIKFVRSGRALSIPDAMLRRAIGRKFDRSKVTVFYLFHDRKSNKAILSPVQLKTRPPANTRWTTKGWYSQPNAGSMQVHASSLIRALGYEPSELNGRVVKASASLGKIVFRLSLPK